MACSEDSGANRQDADSGAREKGDLYEDEIYLMDYFLVLWKHKLFIFLATFLPTLIIGTILFIYPRTYRVTYVYDVRGDVRDDVGNWNLNEKNFNVLQSRFYSEDNLNRLIGELQTHKLDEYAEKVRNFRADASNKFVKFEVSPLFIDLSKLKVTGPDQLETFRDMKTSLLNMTITGKPKEDFAKTALVIRNNFEEVIPLYLIQEQLSTDIRRYNSRLANIESSKFGLELALQNNTEMLAELKKVDIAALDKKGGDVMLQFDVGGRSQYLPLSYQIQAVESKIVELQGKISGDAAMHKYSKDLLGLSARIIAELNDKLSSEQSYSIELFKSFLADLIGETEKQELTDFLASYIKKIENRISVSAPVSENPKICSIAKGTTKKIAIVFAIAIMLSVFAAFLLEGLKQSKMRNEK